MQMERQFKLRSSCVFHKTFLEPLSLITEVDEDIFWNVEKLGKKGSCSHFSQGLRQHLFGAISCLLPVIILLLKTYPKAV